MEGRIHAGAYKSPSEADWLRLFDDVVRVETRLYNALNERLRAAQGITGSQFEFVDYLRRNPGARVGDLARYHAIGVGAASKGVDRLVTSGWARRVPDPDDGRSSLLRLTDQGERLAEAARREAESLVEGLLGRTLRADSLSSVADVFAALRASLEHDGIGTPTG